MSDTMSVTERMKQFSRQIRWRTVKPFEKNTERDRSLNGKARVKARRAANKERA